MVHGRLGGNEGAVMEECVIAYGKAETEQAERILAERFRHAGTEHPLLAWLYDEARIRLLPVCGCNACAPQAVNPLRSREVLPKLVSPPAVSAGEESFEVIAASVKLPAMPQVFHELQSLIERDDATVDELGRVISLDPKMTSSILRLVNSALFSFRSSIDTVSRAVAVLGTRQISTLALGTLMLGLFRERPPECINLEVFWKHSIATGMTARSIARIAGRDNPEKYFVAGLLHDMGWLALCCTQPAMAQRVLDVVDMRRCTFPEAERHVMGFDHARLGGRIFEKWNFPPNLVAAVLHHHAPSRCTEHDEPALVHVADTVVKSLGLGAVADARVLPLDHAAWDMLGMEPQALSGVLASLEGELDQVCRALLMPDAGMPART